jgi:tetratricopeptide (TPR) repeat protein
VAQYLTSAKLYLRYKEYDKAEASALKAAEKDPQDEEAWYVLGQARFELKKYTEMIEAFDKAVAAGDAHKKEISNYRLKLWADNYNAGIKYYNLGRDSAMYFANAVDSLKLAIAAMPESTGTYYVAALSHYGKKDYDGAIDMLNTCIKKDPMKTDAIQLLAQLHSQRARDKKDAKDEAGAKEELAKSAAAYEKLYEAAPNDADNIISLIDVYERAGMGDKALAMTSNCVKTNPNNRVCRYAYGVYLLKKDQFGESIEQLKAMVEIEPENKDEMHKDAMYNLGVANLNWGVSMKEASDKKAEEERKAKKKNIKEDLSYKEKFKAALPYLEKTAEMRKDDAGLYAQLGKLYANLNMTKEAKAAFETSDKIMKAK